MTHLLKLRFTYFGLLFVLLLSCFGITEQLLAQDSLHIEDVSYLLDSTISATTRYSERNLKKKEQEYKTHIEKRDTVKAIRVLLEIGESHSHNANYAKAYDTYWNALLLADKVDNKSLIAHLHQAIGWLYSFYERNDQASKYYNSSLNIRKQLIANEQAEKRIIIENYYGLATLYRKTKQLTLCKSYLDSCFLIQNGQKEETNAYFLKAEFSYYLLSLDKPDEALKIMLEIYPWFEGTTPSYLTIISAFMGDAFKIKNDYANSERCYLYSLANSEKQNSHQDYLPIVYEKLAELYVANNRHKKAYQALLQAKLVNEELYDSRSLSNRPLLEINDEFWKEKQKQNQLIQQQRMQQLEHEDRVSLLQTTILLVGIISLVLFGFLYLRVIKIKHKNERDLLEKTRDMENERNKELLLLKNKELATSALRLIEKDELMKSLKKSLLSSETPPSLRDIKKSFKSITVSNSKNWEEFEARFIAVNQSFYDNLHQSYPNLTPGDKKMCALIKLNFSSKEMAQLMGISVESVHTLRYRLRKKMNLSRADNLTEHLNGF